MFRIKYGIENNAIDVTNLVFSKCSHNNNIIIIPNGDYARALIFSDPLHGIKKSIFIEQDGVTKEYDDSQKIFINIPKIDVYNNQTLPNYTKISLLHNIMDSNKRLKTIQDFLQIDYGDFDSEVPEQIMTSRYIFGNEKILEIGGNIGRNSLIIAFILNSKNNSNLVTLECDTDIANQLIHNKDINNLNFYIENAALSKRNLIQKDWETVVSDTLLEGYKTVNTITLEELNNKYHIEFDTLVLDCEGAFYYILLDMPEILNNIKLIIMENDYTDILHKEYVDKILREANFYTDYVEAGGWGPCTEKFYEVWKKK